MPSNLYSERFFNTMALNEWRIYTIPQYHRAIVRSVTVSWDGAAAGDVHVYVAGLPLIIVHVPGGIGTTALETFGVAYWTEDIRVYIASAAKTYCQISGYLFKDDSGRTGPPHDAIAKPIVPYPPPPAAAEEQ